LQGDPVAKLGVTANEAVRLQKRWAGFKDGTIVWDERVGRKVTFTFDDGPSQVVTPLVLAKLKQHSIPAAFFVNGRRFGGHSAVAIKNRAVLAETARQGHLIGNHSYTHPMMAQISTSRQKWEVRATHRAIIEVTGLRAYIYRPPFGGQTSYSRRVLKRAGYSTVMWNLSSNDPFGRHVKKVHHTVMRKLAHHRGGIILMHDTNAWSACAVPLIVRSILIESCKLLARGEEPYLIVGLEHFWVPPAERMPRPTAAARAQAAAWRKTTLRFCAEHREGPQQASGIPQTKRRGGSK
jgi:peptidoglycan/xylan/chitin deacetylase (PgdA/CDA1 family)